MKDDLLARATASREREAMRSITFAFVVVVGCTGALGEPETQAGSSEDAGAVVVLEAAPFETAPFETAPFESGGPAEVGFFEVGAPETTAEICGNGIDDDRNGIIDEDCSCAVGDTQPCGSGAATPLGACRRGTQTCVRSGEFGRWSTCVGEVLPQAEICGNGIDDDCNGQVDEGCVEICGNGIDDDRDGQIDEGCEQKIPVDIDGDCVTVACPPSIPYPVGCNVTFSGGDHRGCVAHQVGSSTVFFKEGDECGKGWLRGTLTCSTTPGGGLNEANCAINKSSRIYRTHPNQCPR
jgi:hypothetical protein